MDDGPGPLSAFEAKEISYPSPRKILEDGNCRRTIHTTRILPGTGGLPLLSDFGEARFGDEEHNEDVMPNSYRAPEVVLKDELGL